MNQEDKDLLLKDLCARLAYDVTYYHDTDNVVTPKQILDLTEINNILLGIGDNIKPYLRPMSSITEEEISDLQKITSQFCFNKFDNSAYVGDADDGFCSVEEMDNILNYLNSKHFDYRGLIEKGLALEALEGMYD